MSHYVKQYSRDYVSLMPTNLYGPYDNFDLKTSHVLPAMIRKFHDAKINNLPCVELWGSGNPKREFLHVNDLAKAVLFAAENSLENHLYNVGSNSDLTIRKLSEIIQKIVGYNGQIKWNTNKPDGTYRKIMDSSKINKIGWSSKIELEDGIRMTYKWYLDNLEKSNMSLYKQIINYKFSETYRQNFFLEIFCYN